jgi:purine-cytosine permease-like protein
MKVFLIALAACVASYIVFALVGYYLIGKFSSNGHDLGVEASMTSIFVFGPIGAIIGFIAGFIWAKGH